MITFAEWCAQGMPEKFYWRCQPDDVCVTALQYELVPDLPEMPEAVRGKHTYGVEKQVLPRHPTGPWFAYMPLVDCRFVFPSWAQMPAHMREQQHLTDETVGALTLNEYKQYEQGS